MSSSYKGKCCRLISIIVAFDKHRLIGKANELPWHYKEDLQYFKKMTLHKKVLFGKKTFYSIYNKSNKLLPQRKTLVLSHNEVDILGVKTYHSVAEVLKDYLHSEEELFICGGRSIYEAFLEYADKLYITHIDKEYQGDCYFPDIDYSLYELTKQTKSKDLLFCVYRRKGEIT